MRQRFEEVHRVIGNGGGHGHHGTGYANDDEEESSDEIDPDSFDNGDNHDDDNMSVVSADEYGHFDHHRDLSVNSVVFSPEELGIDLERGAHSSRPRVKDDAMVLSELISSMSDYLESARQREMNLMDEELYGVSDERAKQYVERSHLSVGKKVDVLDVSYQWYSATILDVDVLSQKAVLIQ